LRRAAAAGFLVALAATLTAGCFGGSSGKAGGGGEKHTIVLTLANPDGQLRDLAEYVQTVDRLSKGSLRIRVESKWRSREIDYDRGTIADVRGGKVDLAKIGVRSFDTLGVRNFQPLMAPFLVDTLGLEAKILRSPLAAQMLSGADGLGVEGLTLLPGELRRPFGISRRLVSPSDYRGATIGIRPSLVSSTTFRTLGATPRSYVPGHLPRTFDGAELEFVTIEGNRYGRPGTSLTVNVGLWPRAFAVVANKDVLARLDPTKRQILRRAGMTALEPALARLRSDDKDEASTLCRGGRMAFVKADGQQLVALRTAVQPVYDSLERSAQTRRVIRAIERMKNRVAPEPTPGCAATSASSVRGRTPVDGVYEVTTTAGDLRAANAPTRDVIPENYGKWIYVFDRGRFAITQEDKEACTWGYGKFSVKGQQMAWSFLDGGGFGPNNAYNRPGEFFRFGWSRYRDTLTLTPVKGAISPENFRAKPWHLVSTSPSARYLSKTCAPPHEALKPPSEKVLKGSPLVGSWEETYTRKQFVAAKPDPGELEDTGNWGHFVLTFRDGGRYTLVKLDPPVGRSGGSYRLRQGIVTLSCACARGETWPYRWSVYRNKLTLRKVRSREATGLVVKPWRKRE
jgi:TRAP-type C4-dicarboxylate transport system substrate-binding protein